MPDWELVILGSYKPSILNTDKLNTTANETRSTSTAYLGALYFVPAKVNYRNPVPIPSSNGHNVGTHPTAPTQQLSTPQHRAGHPYRESCSAAVPDHLFRASRPHQQLQLPQPGDHLRLIAWFSCPKQKPAKSGACVRRRVMGGVERQRIATSGRGRGVFGGGVWEIGCLDPERLGV